ncbi:MAG: WG repeat-containing protein, partial [candidate division WOR-3 bacterium]
MTRYVKLILVIMFMGLSLLKSEELSYKSKDPNPYFVIKVEGKYGYIDKTAKVVINPQFDEAFSFSEGLARVRIGDKQGYIDKTGKIVINPQFDIACNFSNGLARVKIGDKWSFIDKSGNIIINPQFDEVCDLS